MFDSKVYCSKPHLADLEPWLAPRLVCLDSRTCQQTSKDGLDEPRTRCSQQHLARQPGQAAAAVGLDDDDDRLVDRLVDARTRCRRVRRVRIAVGRGQAHGRCHRRRHRSPRRRAQEQSVGEQFPLPKVIAASPLRSTRENALGGCFPFSIQEMDVCPLSRWPLAFESRDSGITPEVGDR
jgi:hypothetical protein